MRTIRLNYSTYDLMIIALMAGLGLAIKPVIVPLTQMITGPLLIPGGSVAGGFYMLWLVLSGSITGKFGSAFLTALVQALIVMITGTFGSHGAASLISYTLPGLVVELIWLITRSKGRTLISCFFAGIAANISGTFLSNLLFFRLPWIPLLFSLSLAALSGGFGGLVAWQLTCRILKSKAEQSQ